MFHTQVMSCVFRQARTVQSQGLVQRGTRPPERAWQTEAIHDFQLTSSWTGMAEDHSGLRKTSTSTPGGEQRCHIFMMPDARQRQRVNRLPFSQPGGGGAGAPPVPWRKLEHDRQTHHGSTIKHMNRQQETLSYYWEDPPRRSFAVARLAGCRGRQTRGLAALKKRPELASNVPSSSFNGLVGGKSCGGADLNHGASRHHGAFGLERGSLLSRRHDK